jgi:hypothetical protein
LAFYTVKIMNNQNVLNSHGYLCVIAIYSNNEGINRHAI